MLLLACKVMATGQMLLRTAPSKGAWQVQQSTELHTVSTFQWKPIPPAKLQTSARRSEVATTTNMCADCEWQPADKTAPNLSLGLRRDGSAQDEGPEGDVLREKALWELLALFFVEAPRAVGGVTEVLIKEPQHLSGHVTAAVNAFGPRCFSGGPSVKCCLDIGRNATRPQS